MHIWDHRNKRQGWNTSILVPLDSCLQTCMTYTTTECAVNKFLVMDSVTVRNV